MANTKENVKILLTLAKILDKSFRVFQAPTIGQGEKRYSVHVTRYEIVASCHQRGPYHHGIPCDLSKSWKSKRRARLLSAGFISLSKEVQGPLKCVLSLML